MSQVVFKMPDLGEGTVEAEIVAWRTQPGAQVAEDQVIVEVMTDKAAVEVPSPVTGRVVSITGAPGDKVAVGSPLIVFETGASTRALEAPAQRPTARPAASPAPQAARSTSEGATAPPAGTGRVKTSPANRRRAREAGIDLTQLKGTGPGGRIVRGDLAAATTVRAPKPAPASAPGGAAHVPEPTRDVEVKVIGLRRVIAERMSEAKRTIPHFAYVEEVDVTELEALRQHLNAALPKTAAPLTYLPFIVVALARVLEQFPQCNATYDAARGVLIRHGAVHVGIATQTPDGLKVPVMRNAEALDLWQVASRISSLSERARANKSTRDELVGSTITVTSLGKLGGIVSTPVINLPEVAIIGINKAVERPVVRDGAVVVRRMMNLSSSFDHRFVDGYDAAAMIQALKERLEFPATVFIPKVPS